MDNSEVLVEMESLVEGIEQSLAVLIGTISETSDPVALLKNLIGAEEGVGRQYGPNAWRDRLVRKMQIMAALKARRAPGCDASLQTLIATLLQPQDDRGTPH